MLDLDTPEFEPIILKKGKLVYDKLLEESIVIDGYTIFNGFTTKIFDDLKINRSYYGQVINPLKKMNCIRQVIRGNNSQKSQWILFKRPTVDMYRDFISATKTAKSQQTSDIIKRIAVLEENVSKLIEILAENKDLAGLYGQES